MTIQMDPHFINRKDLLERNARGEGVMKFVQFTAPNGSPVHINAEDVTLLRGTNEDWVLQRVAALQIMMVSGASQVIKRITAKRPSNYQHYCVLGASVVAAGAGVSGGGMKDGRATGLSTGFLSFGSMVSSSAFCTVNCALPSMGATTTCGTSTL